MIVFDNTHLIEAVERHEKSKAKIAALAESSAVTLDKVLKGNTDLHLQSIERLADFLGFDVRLSLVAKSN